MIKVAKFGGSSLADAAQFKKVKAIISASTERAFVVPSAPGKRNSKDEKVTDLLYRCQALAAAGESIDAVFQTIAARYMEIAGDLNLSVDIRAHLDTVRQTIAGGASADYAASRGEYLNGLLLADYLGFRFQDAAEIICFTADGVYDAERTQRLIENTVAKERNVVVPGFYGSLPNGDIHVFPRGGSDITGSIVARGVNADVYENWTDVSGFMMADPRVVDSPRTIETVTYSELRELAYMGATVMHEDTIFPVRQACIPINVRNTNAPEEPGTMIVPDDTNRPRTSLMTGIAGRKGFTVIAIAKDNMHNEIGFGFRVLQILKRHRVSFEHIPTGIDTMSIIVAEQQLNGKRQAIVDEILADCNADSVELHDNLALLATVGRGMVSAIGTSARLFGSLARNGVNIRMINQGSSEMNIIVGVEDDDFELAMNAIYEEFKED